MKATEQRTLQNGLRMLELLKRHPKLNATEIGDELGLSTTSTYRILSILQEYKLITKEKSYFQVNQAFFQTVIVNLKKIPWHELITPFEVVKEIQENVYLAVIEDEQLVTKRIVNREGIEIDVQSRKRESKVHHSAIGKVLLAFSSDEDQKTLINNIDFTPMTAQTFQEKDLFLRHIQEINKRGYAIDDEETEIGMRCIAAPILINHEVVAAFAISGSTESISRRKFIQLSKKIIKYSHLVAEELIHLSR
ncbi:IclR family transcriptional regulator [Viridibacillus arvi]|uniref:IclR family transcriptional regulator n=1 Tax=Viridibacillus arvi TaxID=263475 RepID=UPI003D2D78B0